MGLDVDNALFGNFHLSWHGTSWFSDWCKKHEVPDPFIGWVRGDNSGDQCVLGPDNSHSRLAGEWCSAVEEKQPEIAKLGNELLAQQGIVDLFVYLYPLGEGEGISEYEWSRRAVTAWYAILKHGIEHGDTLTYC